MFFTVFATFSALLNLYGQTNYLNRDYKHLITVRSQDGENWTDFSNTQANTNLGTTEGFTFSNLDNTYEQGNPTNQYRLRYFISEAVENASYLGYLDFYFRVSTESNGYLYPTIESHFEKTVNYKLTVNWQVLNTDYPSLTPFNFSYQFDFTKESDLNYYFTQEQGTSMYTVYTNANRKNTMQMMLTGTPVSQEDYNAYTNAYNNGYDEGYNDGFDDGNGYGYNHGYADGYNEASEQDSTAVTIFSGILSVGLLPVNFFLAILNFEVFGINIGAFVSALLTVAIVIIVTRIVINGGSKGD